MVFIGRTDQAMSLTKAATLNRGLEVNASQFDINHKDALPSPNRLTTSLLLQLMHSLLAIIDLSPQWQRCRKSSSTTVFTGEKWMEQHDPQDYVSLEVHRSLIGLPGAEAALQGYGEPHTSIHRDASSCCRDSKHHTHDHFWFCSCDVILSLCAAWRAPWRLAQASLLSCKAVPTYDKSKETPASLPTSFSIP